MSHLGVNINISVHSNQGGRKYMEDVVCGKIVEATDDNEIPDSYAFFAVYDGHGGAEAAKFAEKHLHEEVIKNKGFWSDEDDEILKAIKDGFNSTHKLMWKALPTWPKTVSGLPSTAGTTASVVFIKNDKMYVAHVGDSAVVIGTREKSLSSTQIHAHLVTIDHKPESPKERKRIEANGGKVMAKSGVQRVVWHRPRPSHKGPVRRSTPIDDIPFLAVARALGDLWSYNSEQDVFVVSPDPDTAVYNLDLDKHRCVVLASDGLWNMVRPYESIHMVESKPKNPAMALVNLALCRWRNRNMRADNTSVIVLNLRPIKITPTVHRTPSSVSMASTARLSDADTDSISDMDLDIAAEMEIDAEMELEMENDKIGYMPVPLTPYAKIIGLGHGNHSVWGKSHVKPVHKRPPIYRGPALPMAPGSAPAKLKSSGSRLGYPLTSPLTKASSLPITLERNLHKSNNTSSGKLAANGPVNGLKVDTTLGSSPAGMNNVPSPHNAGSSCNITGKKRPSSDSSCSGDADHQSSAKKLKTNHSTDEDGATSHSSGDAPKTPTRHVAFNLVNKPTSPVTRSMSKPNDSEDVGSPPSRNDLCPKGATSAKSPMKIDVTPRGDSPSHGLISPLWPSDLDHDLDLASCSDNLDLVLKAPSDDGSKPEASKAILQENSVLGLEMCDTHKILTSKRVVQAKGTQNQSPSKRHLAAKHRSAAANRVRYSVRRLRAVSQKMKKGRNSSVHRTRFQARNYQRRS